MKALFVIAAMFGATMLAGCTTYPAGAPSNDAYYYGGWGYDGGGNSNGHYQGGREAGNESGDGRGGGSRGGGRR